MIFNLNWIPEIKYRTEKVLNPFNLNKSEKFIERKIKSGEIQQSNETLFYTLLLIYQTDQLDLIDKESLKNYLLDLKEKEGGFKSNQDNDCADVWSTFFCIASLKLLGVSNFIEEKDIKFIKNLQSLNSGGDGGFFHCSSKACEDNCFGNTSMKSTFYALSTLALVKQLNKINQKAVQDYLKKKPSDDLERIFQMLSLKILNKNEKIDLGKQSSIISIWSIPEGGDRTFPSIKITFWTIICLGLIKKLNLIDFGSMFDFLRIMQQDSGGFTEQYTGLSSQAPNLLDSSLALISIYYVWERLVDLIENDLLKRAQEDSIIYFSNLSIYYSVSSKLVKNIANWLIKKDLISGKIFNIESKFQEYFKEQNAITQNIIEEIIKVIKSNPLKAEIDLNEFSKRFGFSNSLERVKLVVNDLIIKEFLKGKIKSTKKKYSLYDYLVLEEYIEISEPVPYEKIKKQKNKIRRVTKDLLTLSPTLKLLVQKSSKIIESMIEQEKISEAQDRLNKTVEIANLRINSLDNLMDSAKSNKQYPIPDILLNDYEKNWPEEKSSLKKYISSLKSSLEQKIKDKEEFIIKRAKQAEDDMALRNLITLKKEQIIQKLDQNQDKIRDFFLENFTDHEAVYKLLKSGNEFIESLDSKLNSEIKKTNDAFNFNTLLESVDKIKKNWINVREKAKKILDNYEEIIKNRETLQKFIIDKRKELKELIEGFNERITALLGEDKLEESSNLLKESINGFNKALSDKYEIFNKKISMINDEVEEFPDFSNDIIHDYNQALKDEESKWNEFLSSLKNNLNSKLEIESRDELQQKIENGIEDIKKTIEKMDNIVSQLIQNEKFSDSENNINEFYSEISLKIKKYNQEFESFINTASKKFGTFEETVSKLIQNWIDFKEKLETNLDELKKELLIKLDKGNSEYKEDEIYERIEKEMSKLDNELNKLELKYNLILKSRKNLEENEAKFEAEHSEIIESLNKFNSEIKNSIRYAAKKFTFFNGRKEDIDSYWETTKRGAEKKIKSIQSKISDDFFIKNVQFIVSAFKGKRIEISYLSKVMKIKPSPLKLKLITLISNSKLDGELDSGNDTFMLTDGVVHEGVPLKDLELTEEELAEDEDEIIRREILKMRYLMVIHYRVGASVYSRKLGHWKMDSDMIGGFLTAMQDFSAEIKKKNIPMKRMEYKEFEILIEQGKYVFAALFIDQKESEWLRKKLISYVKKFEKYFESGLKQWRGELATFSNSGFLVDEVFELYRV